MFVISNTQHNKNEWMKNILKMHEKHTQMYIKASHGQHFLVTMLQMFSCLRYD